MDYEACLLTLLLSIPTPDLDGRCDMDILLKNFYKDTTLLFAFLISYIFLAKEQCFLSQQISEQYFSACLFSEANRA
jgi:hypothetical protein